MSLLEARNTNIVHPCGKRTIITQWSLVFRSLTRKISLFYHHTAAVSKNTVSTIAKNKTERERESGGRPMF